MFDAHKVREIIAEALATTHLEVTTDDNVHFEATVVSEAFEGLTRIKQHQKVNAILTEHFKSGAIHALQLNTYTPSTYQKKLAAANG